MFILISGAARSGKSSYAEQRLYGMDGSIKLYVATAEIYDDEMLSRVELHRQRRQNLGFTTIERTRGLGGLDIPEGACVMIEGLATWTANEMFRPEGVFMEAGRKVYDDFMRLKGKAENIIAVADDIFSDGITYDDTTELYRRTLAGLMIKLAREADEVIEVFAGIPVSCKVSS